MNLRGPHTATLRGNEGALHQSDAIHLERMIKRQVQKSAPHYTEAAYDEIELLAEAVGSRVGRQ